jgi:hypothetical protein
MGIDDQLPALLGLPSPTPAPKASKKQALHQINRLT